MEKKSIYSYTVKVDLHDVDFNGICRAASLLKYIQSGAQNQLTENSLSYDEMIKMKRAFIVSRMKLEILFPVKVYDELEIITFPCESRGFSFIRCYKILREGIEVARALSVSALTDTDTHSLIRVSDFELGIEPTAALDIEMPHLKLPKETELLGKYRVVYADLDQNNHLNNTKYADMISNFLPLSRKRIKSILINYQNEAKWNEELSVERAMADGKFYVRTVRSDGKINSESEIEITDI